MYMVGCGCCEGLVFEGYVLFNTKASMTGSILPHLVIGLDILLYQASTEGIVPYR